MVASPAVSMRDIARYAQLKDSKRVLEAEIDKLKDELRAMELRILDHFADEGIQSLKIDTGFTVYLRGQWWARPTDGDYPRACAALEAAGLGAMVHETVNIQTLSAYVREVKKEDISADLPSTLDGAIDITQQFNVLVRKS